MNDVRAEIDHGPPPDDAPRTPPANVEAEQAVLAAILGNNRVYEQIADIVGSEDFADPAHARIFRAAGEVIDKGQPASAVTLHPQFEHDPDLADMGGGRQYLADLQAAHTAVIDARHHARQLRDLRIRRDLIDVCQRALDQAYAPDTGTSADGLIGELDKALLDTARPETAGNGPAALSETVGKTLERVEQRAQIREAGGAPGLRTGLTELDSVVDSLEAGWLVTLAGATGMGKTALATTIAHNVARTGWVAFWSGEMPKDQLNQRLLAAESGIQHTRIRTGQLDPSDWEALTAAERRLAQHGLVIDDRQRLGVADLRHMARRLHRRHGLSMLVVDYLQKLKAGDDRVRREQQVAQQTWALKCLAQELGIPIVLLSQLSRNVDYRQDKRPTLGDLRESGAIEQDSDVVLFAYREDYYLKQAEPEQRADENEEKFNARRRAWLDRLTRVSGTAEAIVAKQRHGPTGSARLGFDGQRVRFTNLDDDTAAPDGGLDQDQHDMLGAP